MKTRDLISDGRFAAAVFWLPALLLIASGNLNIGVAWRTAIWTISLSIMGSGCIVNALRCGRVHCYFTGPFFFVMAIVTLLYGLGLLALGERGWSTISLTVLIGAVVLCYVPEFSFGRYRQSIEPPSGINSK